MSQSRRWVGESYHVEVRNKGKRGFLGEWGVRSGRIEDTEGEKDAVRSV